MTNEELVASLSVVVIWARVLTSTRRLLGENFSDFFDDLLFTEPQQGRELGIRDRENSQFLQNA